MRHVAVALTVLCAAELVLLASPVAAAPVAAQFTGAITEVEFDGQSFVDWVTGRMTFVPFASPELQDAITTSGIEPGAPVTGSWSYPEPLFAPGSRAATSFELTLGDQGFSDLGAVTVSVTDRTPGRFAGEDSLLVSSNLQTAPFLVPQGTTAGVSVEFAGPTSLIDFEAGLIPDDLLLADFSGRGTYRLSGLVTVEFEMVELHVAVDEPAAPLLVVVVGMWALGRSASQVVARVET